jgi:hypothetical protein
MFAATPKTFPVIAEIGFRHMSEVGVVVNHYGVALDIPFSDTVESSFS